MMRRPLKQILLVEDNRTIGDSVSLALEGEGYRTTVARDLESARQRVEKAKFDLFILDVSLPDGTGFEFCTELRLKDPSVPIIMLTAKIDENSVVQGLSIGANDYIRKPFSNRELIARVKKCLDEKIVRSKKLSFEGLELNVDTREAAYAGKSIELKPREFSVLSILIQNKGDVVPRQELLRLIDRDANILDSSLDPHISRIRKALEKSGAKEIQITNSYGLGFRLEKK